MLPLLLPLAQSDIGARAGVEESYVQSASNLSSSSFMTGVTAGASGRTAGKSSSLSFDASAYYGRLVQVTIGASDGPATNNYSASLGTGATFEIGPATQLSFEGAGFIASRLAVQADNLLAARDPFLGDRVEYSVSATSRLSGAATSRLGYALSTGYLGAGGITSSDPRAVGADLHGVRATVSFPYELAPRTSMSPELAYGYSHYYNALLDSNLRRGPADVQSGRALLSLTQVLSHRLLASAGGGVSVASPPPIFGSDAAVVAPEARASATYLSSSSSVNVSYSYAYTSLGPRIGFGQQHMGVVEFAILPVSGGPWRDLEVRWATSVSYGSAPVEIALLSMPTSGLPPTQEGKLTTFSTATGVHIALPLVRGFEVTSGYELQVSRGTFSPPTGQDAGMQLGSVLSVGLLAVTSTDPQQMLRRSVVGERAEERALPLGLADGRDIDEVRRDPEGDSPQRASSASPDEASGDDDEPPAGPPSGVGTQRGRQ